MDSLTTTTVKVGDQFQITGLRVDAFSAELFIVLILTIGLGLVAWKYGPKLFVSRRKTECKTCMRIVSTLNDTYRSKINSVKHSILHDQLSFADLVFSSIESKIISLYKKSLDELKVDPKRQREELIMYKSFLANETEGLKMFIRLRLKENHLSRFNREQFETYAREVSNKIATDVRLDMNSKWVEFFSVPVEMNKIAIDEHIETFLRDLRSIFSNAYEVTIKKEAEIKELEDRFEKDLDQLVRDSKGGKI